VFRVIVEFAPDVIVAAEVAASEIAVLARRRGLTSAPIVNVVTDHHAEPAWVKREVFAYAVASEAVRDQLREWGARPEGVTVTGIPTAAEFRASSDAASTRLRYHIAHDVPLVVLMGGGMGPTRMDAIADALCASRRPLHVLAVAGRDRRAFATLSRLAHRYPDTLTVRAWIDDVGDVMKAASVLVTKPGGITTAEAAVCGVPMVMFDPIPGPEEHNASRVERTGAGILIRGTQDALAAIEGLLDDPSARAAMSARSAVSGTPAAADMVARLVGEAYDAARRPGLLALTIGNGAGHTSAAEAIAAAAGLRAPSLRIELLDVADYMTATARLTHVTIYLWLVRHAPRLWDRIDRYQKRQQHTSPEWYYRKGCRALFEFTRRLQPAAIVATEVGCCEVAALIKRDLGLASPLIAVNGEYDAECAWVQPEVDMYCVPEAHVLQELADAGAPRSRIVAWGVPLAPQYSTPIDRDAARAAVCRRLGFDRERPIVLVSGGSEGLGRPDAVAARILSLRSEPQAIVLAGRSRALQRRCEALAGRRATARLRVLGWTPDVRELMEAADLLVGKLGHTFDEAIATELPVVALPPPPGSERVQYRLLDVWGIGHAVGSLDEMAAVVERLLSDPARLDALRQMAAPHRRTDAAGRIASWIVERAADRAAPPFARERSA
jgi:processive 1,2-diacylglycerol beta-glucosyltransferase